MVWVSGLEKPFAILVAKLAVFEELLEPHGRFKEVAESARNLRTEISKTVATAQKQKLGKMVTALEDVGKAGRSAGESWKKDLNRQSTWAEIIRSFEHRRHWCRLSSAGSFSLASRMPMRNACGREDNREDKGGRTCWTVASLSESS